MSMQSNGSNGSNGSLVSQLLARTGGRAKRGQRVAHRAGIAWAGDGCRYRAWGDRAFAAGSDRWNC